MSNTNEGQRRPQPSHANVVVLLVDEHNPRYASIYGHPTVRTPNLERLAARGTVYDACYAPSPLCRPCRSSFLSGRYVHETQAYNNSSVFATSPRAFPSYGTILDRQGVHTVHIGKADAYAPTRELDFTELDLAEDRRPPGDTSVSRHPLAIRNGGDGSNRAEGYGVRERPFAGDDRIVASAIEWLTTTAPKLNAAGTPWTLVVNINKPHFPHLVTQELWDLYPNGGDLPRYGVNGGPNGEGKETANHPYAQDLRAHFGTASFGEEQIRGLRRGYLGCVTAADRQLGRLLDTLDKTGQTKETVVAYSSDHGEMLGKWGMWWKCSLYEDSARIPLVVAGPGFRAGVRSRTPVTLLDLQATLFRAVGGRRPSDWHGSPLQGLALNDDRRVGFAEYHGHGTRSSGYLIRQGPWKLLYNSDGPHQLFNLKDDPEELTNQFSRQPGIAQRLTRELRTICDPEKENQRAEAYIRRQSIATAGRPGRDQ
ncbi:MAG: sulfatase-like hydrolase/transferase [Armatimonadota bacterium]